MRRCVCVSTERDRDREIERERDRDRERERERERECKGGFCALAIVLICKSCLVSPQVTGDK